MPPQGKDGKPGTGTYLPVSPRFLYPCCRCQIPRIHSGVRDQLSSSPHGRKAISSGLRLRSRTSSRGLNCSSRAWLQDLSIALFTGFPTTEGGHVTLTLGAEAGRGDARGRAGGGGGGGAARGGGRQ